MFIVSENAIFQELLAPRLESSELDALADIGLQAVLETFKSGHSARIQSHPNDLEDHSAAVDHPSSHR